MSLKVYNSLEQKIAELAGNEFSAGRHELTFNASNLANGIYFYVLKAGNFSTAGIRIGFYLLAVNKKIFSAFFE